MNAAAMNAILVSTDVLARILDRRQAPDEPIDAILRRCFSAPAPFAPAAQNDYQATSETHDPPRDETFGSRFLDVDARQDRSLTAMEALISDLRRLAGPDAETFYPRLACAIAGRERRHVARSPRGVYPFRPDLAQYHTTELSRRWFIGTNIANREKRKILREACRLRGLQPVRASSLSGANR